MRRHPLDPLSLVAGLACITFAVAALAAELDVHDLDRGLLVPAILIVVAVLLVAGLRPGSGEGSASAAPGRDGVDDPVEAERAAQATE
jgi:hypothetical protein